MTFELKFNAVVNLLAFGIRYEPGRSCPVFL